MEDLMYYVWQQRLFLTLRVASGFETDDVEILNPGLRNLDAGPDFFNAKLRIGRVTWAGNVEMHVRASDWHRHHHDGDAAYANVILHVVLVADDDVRLPSGEAIPTVVMTLPDGVVARYRQLVGQGDGRRQLSPVACADRVATVPAVVMHDWQTALAVERMMEKARRVTTLTEGAMASWPAAMYVALARALGTGINSDAFERTARSLPYEYLQKHLDNPLQVEAMLFGQAGWLADERPEAGDYYRSLRREYTFLAAKFGLSPVPLAAWRMARLRPQGHPHLRMAALAALVARRDLLPSLLMGGRLDELLDRLAVTLGGHWTTHFSLDGPAVAPRRATLGRQTLLSVVINAVVPVAYAYGQWQGDEEATDRAVALLQSIAPESNRYTRLWTDAGLNLRSSFDSQAMLQLIRRYCEPRRCMSCRIGCSLVKQEAQSARQ